MIADLADFEKQELQQLADNLRKPGGRIPDPNPNAAPGATIPMPAFTYGAKSQKRLTVATDGQSRATKQEQANLCAVTVLCAST